MNITGTKGNDFLYGTAGADAFDGLGGSDTYIITPNDGLDRFSDTGTTGTDMIVAGGNGVTIGLASGFGPASGIEEISAAGFTGVKIEGSYGADVFDFSSTILTGIGPISVYGGSDRVTGSAGDDHINGCNGDDVLKGGAGNDTLLGGAPNDLDVAKDIQHGYDGQDTLKGGGGADLIAGGQGNDYLSGGAGADRLLGGTGSDTLYGGGGADTFVFQIGDAVIDFINDFQPGVDKMDFSEISGAITWNSGDMATSVNVDLDGDGDSDISVLLSGNMTLTASDFLI